MNINYYPGHMAKTKRLIKENISKIDIVYELVDARVPISSKIAGIDDLINNKPKILIMTKSDLCDVSITSKYVKYYESIGYKVLLINLKNNNDYKKIIKATNELMASLQEKRVEKGLKTKEIKALVLGIPNVGKSTLINALALRKATKVGNKPGITKDISWLKTNSNILLLDTPGILWPKFDDEKIFLNLCSIGTIKEDVLDEYEVARHILTILATYYPHILSDRYNINNVNPEDINELYDMIGKNKNLLSKGSEVDYDRVSKFIINDIRQGYIKGITFDRSDI